MTQPDETTSIATAELDLKALVLRIKEESEKAGLFLNIKKTKIMTTGTMNQLKINNEKIEIINGFESLRIEVTETEEMRKKYCEE